MSSMERMYRNSIIGLGMIFITIFPSCNNSNEEQPESTFDRGILLENMASQLILPNFEQLQSSVNSLVSATNNFTAATNESNLVELRNAWLTSVTDLQHCSAFGFGPGELPLGPFATVIGVFPVNEAQIEENITDPDFNLSASFLRDIRGFYTVEYLIYGAGQSDSEIVSSFNQQRLDYLNLVVDEIQTTINAIVQEWNTTYRQEFTENTGTSAGSPISLLYNSFVQDYENLKNFKVELPAGLTAGQTSAEPDLVEAFYSGISTSLIEGHFENSKNIWRGRSRSGQDFVGFEEYLATLVGGPELIELTESAITDIDTAIAALPPGRLSDNITSTEVALLRDELQENTPNFKSSMSSLLGISITFNSGDGD